MRRAVEASLVFAGWTGYALEDCNNPSPQSFRSPEDARVVKSIAFYLPQFHPIPQNDAWWGEGFTEWNNVTSAAPGFAGHYQPHVPSSRLGYYDLRDPQVLEIQAALAKQFSVHGFCYYYYWFNGAKLLDTPLNNLLANPNIPKRFCLCWANSDWTRAWYGQNKQVLIAQEYTARHALALARDLASPMADARYITAGGRPLLLVYQMELLPDPKLYTDTIREEHVRLGLAEPLIGCIEALAWGYDPAIYGCDFAVEFAPDWRNLGPLVQAEGEPRQVLYNTVAANMIAKPVPDYTRLRCVFPMWDNTPRYKRNAMVIQNDAPAAFRFFMEKAVEYTRMHLGEDEQFVFINAWNEWGEGCHLEPDRKFGYAWLRAMKEVFG